MSDVAQAYRYAHASFVAADQRPHLFLATSDASGTGQPYFFEGRVLSARLMSELLTTVHLVVGSRFFTPPNTLAKAIALADPVVTSGAGLLRFEGFSSCCSTYVRVDLLPAGYQGELVGKGTTNVDFNAPMKAALARVSDSGGLDLSVGADQLRLRSGGHEVVERKVALPQRWLRGMVEVQAYMGSMRRRFQVSGLQAQRFIRNLPRVSTSRTPLWIALGAAGLAASTQRGAQAVRVTETQRLRLLEPLLARAASLSVYADDAGQASAWVLDFGASRITLALSAEVWRGFSGEGQALQALLRHDAGGDLLFNTLRAQLQWLPSLDIDAVASSLAAPPAAIDDCLRVLGSCGLVGYDVFERRYFHRVLPLDLASVADLHPRLRDAKALLAQNAVTLHASAPLDATVQGKQVAHRVREVDGEVGCTCPWFGQHQGQRGPCKHVLAAQALANPTTNPATLEDGAP